MEIREAVRLRKSIRGYKPDPVPKDLLREILEIATRSPSAGNLQTWEITVVTGEVIENIKRGNAEKHLPSFSNWHKCGPRSCGLVGE